MAPDKKPLRPISGPKRLLQRGRTHAALAACYAAVSVAAITVPVKAATVCPTWLPVGAGDAKRTVEPADLATLRDFGDLGIFSTKPVVALSPHGDRVAMIIRQARPAQNDYCTALLVAPVDGRAPPRIVADAGDVVRAPFEKYGIYGLRSGIPYVPPVLWSPDATWIVWVRQVSGRSEIWRVHPDGTTPALVVRSAVQIDGLEWSKDGRSLVFQSRPGLVDAQRDIDHEGLTGFRYDGRFWPLAAMRPLPTSASIEAVTQRVDLMTGMQLPLEPGQPAAPDGATLTARATSHDRLAWTAPPNPTGIFQPNQLHLRIGGHDRPCAGAQCRDVIGIWWTDHDQVLLVLRRDGVAHSRVALYRWDVRRTHAERLLDSEDMLFGCQPLGEDLLCAHEGSLQPRDLVRISGRSGTSHVVLDPNPEWRQLRTGPVTRLYWTNRFGEETFGDLVLPPGYRPGARLPLVITQYDSRGFLRGGTADDYPIQAFAAHGFAVLSFNRPPWAALAHDPASDTEFNRLDLENWADRRNYQASLEAVVRNLAGQGIIDPARVGITGQSDGASAAEFGLVHSEIFAAAALSTCCDDANMMWEIGPGFASDYHADGYPSAGDPAPAFWKETSLNLNADHHPVPLLIQASDEEARMALATYMTLKNAGWPIEMVVYPDENHVKFWPAHRLAVYDRSIAFFERWLGKGAVPGGGVPVVAGPSQVHSVNQASMSPN